MIAMTSVTPTVLSHVLRGTLRMCAARVRRVFGIRRPEQLGSHLRVCGRGRLQDQPFQKAICAGDSRTTFRVIPADKSFYDNLAELA